MTKEIDQKNQKIKALEKENKQKQADLDEKTKELKTKEKEILTK